MGAFVATTASPAGKALVTRLGADLVIDYREEDFWKVLAGYDCLYDVFGGKSLDEGFKILRRGGRIVSLNGTPNARFGKVPALGVPEDHGPARRLDSPHVAQRSDTA